MQTQTEENPRSQSNPASAETTGNGTSPAHAPQSGMSILLNIFVYMVLIPAVILMLARLLIE